MTVRELQEKLSKLNPDLPVVCVSEDEKLLSERQIFRLLDIISVDVTEAEMCRLDDGTPYLKFGKSEACREIAFLDVTIDF